MRPQSLNKQNQYRLCRWLEDHGIRQDKTHTADLASIALNFKINPADISAAAEAIGMSYREAGKKPTDIFAREIIRILNALDMEVPNDIIRVSQKKGA